MRESFDAADAAYRRAKELFEELGLRLALAVDAALHECRALLGGAHTSPTLEATVLSSVGGLEGPA